MAMSTSSPSEKCRRAAAQAASSTRRCSTAPAKSAAARSAPSKPERSPRRRAASSSTVTPARSAAGAWEALRAYPWPGNLAELREVLFDSADRAVGGKIDLAELPSTVRLASQLEQQPVQRARPLELERLMAAVESRLIALALRRCDGNRGRAAELLGMPRARLLRRIDTLGLSGESEGPVNAPPSDPPGS